MSDLGFRELLDAQPNKLGDAAAEWTRMADKLKRLETQVINDLVKPLRNSGWAGNSAEIAYGIFDRLDDEFELTARQVRNAGILMRWAKEEFGKIQRQLQDLVNQVRQDGLEIDQQGQVQEPRGYVSTTDPAYPRYQQLIARAREYNDRIRRILREANRLDGDVARALWRFLPRNPGEMAHGEWRDASFDARTTLELMGMHERDIPPATTDPRTARRWWDGLTDEQRALYLAAHPDRVGALDGLPTPTRHEANMASLRNLIEARAASDGPTGRLTELLDRLERSEYGPTERRLYLLGVNNQLDGMGIVSVGNPDTARHLGVAVVPGITTTLDDMGGQIERAERIRQTADNLTPDVVGDVAVIAWIGYDTPGIVTAPLHSYADTAAPVLDRFVDGTRVAQEGEGNLTSHRTIIGHSYGSTVVGLAASQGNGLDVHDIIVAGSPGMRVPDVSHLNLDARHVWAGRGAYDYVPHIGPPSHGSPDIWPPSIGTAPHSESFGANRFVVDTTGHTDYWRPDSQSLRNQALIMMGQYRRVGLVHGSPPQ